MRVYEVMKRLEAGIPREAEWSQGEAYGGYYIDSSADIRRVLFCVTPTREVIRLFKEGGYDLLVSHHPFLMDADIPQAIFHTALDCCQGGLNDQWKDALRIKKARHFDGTLGWVGEIEPVSLQDLIAQCERFIGHKVIGQTYSEIETIQTVVVCSGLGGLVTDLALKTGADCYILGEATEAASEMGFKAVIEIGHTLSEQMGVNLVRAILPGVEVDLAPLEADYFGREVYRR